MGIRLSIDILQLRASSMGGKLLSKTYSSCHELLEWQCDKGHIWKTSWNCAKRHWCPSCDGQSKPSMTTLQQYATNKKGLLLSTEYVNARKPLQWQCEFGHIWKGCWGDIKNANHWCPECCTNNKPYNIKALKEYALSKQGLLLLSEKYINCKTNLLWQCKKGHQWNATWDNINRNKWCPYCGYCKTEEICRQLFEAKLKILFPKKRIIYNNNRYYFDGYNKENKIAFEYHGYQHYIYPNHFHKTEDKFLKSQQRDKDKEQYCIDNNIILIVIPYTIKDLANYISNLSIPVLV